MQANKIIRLLVIPVMALTVQGCFVAKDYHRPEVINEDYFRTDMLPEDSVSLAEVSWQEIFTDPILIQHINYGLENNIDIRVALQRLVAAEAYFKQGKAGNLPSLNAGFQVSHQQLSNNSQFGAFFDGGITQYDLTGTLSWEADVWGRIRSTRRAAEAGFLQSVAAHQAVKTQLISRISSLYFQLLSFDEQLRILEVTVANRESSLETTRALKDAGVVTELAVVQTDAQLYSAKAQWVSMQQNIALLENTLSVLLGKEAGSMERSNIEEQAVQIDEKQTGYPVQLLRNRPDVIAAEQNLISAFELTNVAKTEFYPRLSISATGGFQSLEIDQLFSVNSLFANIIGGLTQPILNNRRIRTQYEVSLTQQEIAFLNFRQTLLNAGKEVSDAIYTMHAAEERIVLKGAEYQSYETAVGYSEELLNSGMANYLEVLTARQNALNARLQLVEARYIRLNSAVELYRALGGGWK